ncbi:VOC family protein [Nonomuraea sp. NPDC050328]|uniref:VOC family protein n=1 Tax=Nonomuraea sp. NPDC050328 TaxID=3364361 RepID=UPI0037BD223F
MAYSPSTPRRWSARHCRTRPGAPTAPGCACSCPGWPTTPPPIPPIPSPIGRRGTGRCATTECGCCATAPPSAAASTSTPLSPHWTTSTSAEAWARPTSPAKTCPKAHRAPCLSFSTPRAVHPAQAVGYFWSRALDYPLVWDQDEETAIRAPHGGPKITWGGPPVAPKLGKNRLHFDLAVPPGGSAREEAERLVALGAAVVGKEPGRFLMTDPEGNEFCLLTGR